MRECLRQFYKKMVKKVFKLLSKIIFRYSIIGLFIVILGYFVTQYFALPYATKSETIYIPNVQMMHVDDAVKELSSKGINNIKIQYIDYNQNYDVNEVVDMTPRPLTKIKKHKSVILSVISSEQEYMLEDYKGSSLRSVELEFNRNNIYISDKKYFYDNNIPYNHIIKILPEKGTFITSRDKITAIVSQGEHPGRYIVPNLINEIGEDAALRILKRSNLNLGNVTYEYDDTKLPGTIIEQSFPENMLVSYPAHIDIVISKEREE